ncbi:hypothetical protein [Streptomyces sp. NPDC086023]|uniref:hypothetical protein n=1 Tax=Streptomyces sp. NPDC086023 TaxID=3365746 RepID=UPI0037CECFF7
MEIKDAATAGTTGIERKIIKLIDGLDHEKLVKLKECLYDGDPLEDLRRNHSADLLAQVNVQRYRQQLVAADELIRFLQALMASSERGDDDELQAILNGLQLICQSYRDGYANALKYRYENFEDDLRSYDLSFAEELEKYRDVMAAMFHVEDGMAERVKRADIGKGVERGKEAFEQLKVKQKKESEVAKKIKFKNKGYSLVETFVENGTLPRNGKGSPVTSVLNVGGAQVKSFSTDGVSANGLRGLISTLMGGENPEGRDVFCCGEFKALAKYLAGKGVNTESRAEVERAVAGMGTMRVTCHTFEWREGKWNYLAPCGNCQIYMQKLRWKSNYSK